MRYTRDKFEKVRKKEKKDRIANGRDVDRSECLELQRENYKLEKQLPGYEEQNEKERVINSGEKRKKFRKTEYKRRKLKKWREKNGRKFRRKSK